MDKQSVNKNRSLKKTYQDTYANDIIKLMSEGYSLSACAAQLNVTCESLYSWQKEYPAFNEAIKLGQAKRLFFWEQKLLDPELKPVFLRAILFTLQNIAPLEWKDKEQDNLLNSMTVNKIELVAPDLARNYYINKEKK
ncbi:helix-turn-helix domain-containing protein [Bartonella sp. DGB1]|uniref:helix-turn-helix domain-containing protein n=1 Tax=Bartonella sp. DGB1 TaxID=3239807 RepID=UPI003524A9C9